MGEELAAGIVTAIAAVIAAFITARAQAKKAAADVEAKIEAWKLLYEHDSDGRKISGDLTKLIAAVESAYQIRVKIYQEKWTEVMDAQWSFTEDGLVHVLNTQQVSLGPGPDGNYRFFDDVYHYFVLVNSRGKHHAKRVFIDGRPHKTSDTKRRMAWYAIMPSHK